MPFSTDQLEAMLFALKGMENAIQELRYTARLCARLEQESSVSPQADGTYAAVYTSQLDIWTHSFLVFDLERRVEALHAQFEAACDGKAVAHG
jgi:hypothetical protein